ncbi:MULTISPECIES: TRAP transporter small permease subunit [Ramlibacter]|uniref:TRAP transporter small permease protein n=1 Tax=Ramlibacter pinisoli TaxID=2682844 RepID=A0A6N8IPJ1_9BURK|nr:MULTISPECIES: TRAP transporter small permease [Ramlibacter]MBA2963508.1 TRAP transporter small permease [Ramlibacter sp. CGMCC 1.13660]MVQ28475.1 TRAP transporter small permease subunit [Ramlibacter pinisoli]
MKTLLPPGPASRAVAGFTDAAALACGWWLIGLSVVTCVEMLGRKLLGFSLQGVDEVGSYTYAVVGSIGFAHTLVSRSHTRVDFLLSKFSPRVQAVLNLLAMLTLTALALLCLWRGLNVVLESVDMKSTAATPLATPMWIPQVVWLFGYLLFAVVALLAAGHCLRLFVTGQHGQLNGQFGPQTLEEEIEAETELHLQPSADTDATAAPLAGAKA